MRTILRRREGAAMVEFAIAAPITLMLIIGTLKMGVFYFAQNSVTYAIDEVARAAEVYPTPSDSSLQSTFSNALLKQESSIAVTMTITHGATSGVKYIDLATSYQLPVVIPFTSVTSIPVGSKRRVYSFH